MDARSVADRLERICDQEQDARALRGQLLATLRRAVPFDAHAFVLTDPASEVGVDPLAEVPCLPELPTLVRLKYLTAVNRWTTLGGAPASAPPSGTSPVPPVAPPIAPPTAPPVSPPSAPPTAPPPAPPVAALRTATADQPQRSLVWRGLQSRYDVGDVASAVFRDRNGCWAFLDLWRIGADARFTASELGFLARIAPPVTAALRRAQARTLLTRPPARPEPTGPVVLLLSPELAVQGQTPQVPEYLRTLLPPDPGAPPVPAAAYNVAAQLLAREAGVDGHPATARVHLAAGRWLTVRADRFDDAGAGLRPIAVTIEASSPAERSDLVARAFALSPREAELLAHVAAGHGTREIAALMVLSEYTVQDHLKSVTAKTGVRTRRALAGLVTGG